jgi:hypothetical protein
MVEDKCWRHPRAVWWECYIHSSLCHLHIDIYTSILETRRCVYYSHYRTANSGMISKHMATGCVTNTRYGISQKGDLVKKIGLIKRQNRDNLLHLIWNANSVWLQHIAWHTKWRILKTTIGKICVSTSLSIFWVWFYQFRVTARQQFGKTSRNKRRIRIL